MTAIIVIAALLYAVIVMCLIDAFLRARRQAWSIQVLDDVTVDLRERVEALEGGKK